MLITLTFTSQSIQLYNKTAANNDTNKYHLVTTRYNNVHIQVYKIYILYIKIQKYHTVPLQVHLNINNFQ